MNYLETAEKLADLLLETPQYQAFISSKEELAEDVTAQLLLQSLEELKEEVAGYSSQGEKLPEHIQKRINEMNKKIAVNDAVQKYNQGLEGFQSLVQQVNEVIAQKSGVGLASSSGCGGGGCPRKGA